MQYVTRTKQNTSWNLLIMILWENTLTAVLETVTGNSKRKPCCAIKLELLPCYETHSLQVFSSWQIDLTYAALT